MRGKLAWLQILLGGLALLYLIEHTLLSPAGHAAWTGIVRAVIFKQRELGRPALNLRVISVFFLAALLHLLYDLFSFAGSSVTISAISVNPLSLVVALVSVTFLLLRVREARRNQQGGPSGGGRPKVA